MQHEAPAPPGAVAPSLLDHMDALWGHLSTDDKRALRLCCTATRDDVDARARGLDGAPTAPVLAPATCARMSCVNNLTLRSMACLSGMLVEPPHSGGFVPRLKSLRLLLQEEMYEVRAS
jgi:hypothetical protein